MATFGEGAIKNVAILVAMEEEAAPMIEKMGLTRSDAPLGPASAPMIVHTGTYNDATITVVQPGKDAATGVNNVGTVPAALATFLACSTLKVRVRGRAVKEWNSDSRSASIRRHRARVWSRSRSVRRDQ